MRTLASLCAVACCLGLSTGALAADGEEDEYYLLGDYGVRIDLPDDWRSSEWSDAGLEAEKEDRSIKLFAWGTDLQIPVVEADLDAWSKVFVDKADRIGGKNIEVTRSAVDTIGGRKVARFELAFDFGKDLKGALSGATIEVAGKDLHLAMMTASARSFLLPPAMQGVLERSEFRKPPAPLAFGGQVEGAGVSATLPEGWRPPLPNEVGVVAGEARKLGLDDISACWTALRPHVGVKPDIMVTCQKGMLLGVVDDFSFDGVDATLRGKLFPGTEVPAAEKVANTDGRVGLFYRPTLGAHTLRLGVMPYGDGVAMTWLLGQSGEEADFDAAVRHVLSTAAYTGDHPAGLGEVASYYVTYRPTSPPVLGLAGVVVVLIGGIVFLATRKKANPYED